MVELLAAVGVLSILLGQLLPSLAGERRHAIHYRELNVVRGGVAALEAYAASNGGYYPCASELAFLANGYWRRPLARAGLLDSSDRELDIYEMAMALVCHPSYQAPGATLPPVQLRSQPIHPGHVRYPSQKGLLCPAIVEVQGVQRQWCIEDDLWSPPAENPAGAVAFVDGSATRASRIDLRVDHWYIPENMIGVPVVTTWFGADGRDR